MISCFLVVARLQNEGEGATVTLQYNSVKQICDRPFSIIAVQYYYQDRWLR